MKKLPGLTAGALVLACTLISMPAQAGNVGFRAVDVAYDGERMLSAVWYPTGAPSTEARFGPFIMKVAPGAPIGAGKHGLVLISHGTRGHPLGHRDTAIALAKAGWIVAAPEHPGDSWNDSRHSGTGASWRHRPQQLSAAISRLLEHPDFGQHIDPRRIGAVGHSIGGYSVLTLGGGRSDMRVLVRHCTERADEDPAFCALGRSGTGAGGLLPDMTDSRVGAIVAVAPVGAGFGPRAFESVTVPVQVHQLGDDLVLRWPWHARHVSRLIGDRARLTVHPGVHHFAFVSPFPAVLAGVVGAPARDPDGFDRAAFIARINEQIIGFLAEALPG